MNYFISDLHFGHKNCLRFDNRNFDTIEDMDNTIIKNWNNVVNTEDDVYILGDISWYNSTKTIEIFNQLNGVLHLIIGNHDSKLLRDRKLKDLFIETVNYKELYVDNNTSIVLCHYPIPCFKNHYYGWYHLYGHVHNSWEQTIMEHTKDEIEANGVPCNMYNVGCMIDYMNYTPRTLEEIIEGANNNEMSRLL